MIDNIRDWNPWWKDPDSITILSGKRRTETDYLIGTLGDNKVTIISGIRRSGKTTLMYQMIDHLISSGTDPNNILFLGLEDPALIEFDVSDLIGEYRREFDPTGRTYIFLDEVQAKHGWERTIRKENDIQRDQKIVVSGSSSRIISGSYATLLTGRNLTFFVRPLSFRDYVSFTEGVEFKPSGTRDIERLDSILRKYMVVGGFPEVILEPEVLRKATLNQYFKDIIHRDIIDQYKSDPLKVTKLAAFLMSNIGKEVTLSSLRRSVGLSFDAIRDYLEYLTKSGLFVLVREFSFGLKPSVSDSKKHKVYCADLGMARNFYGRWAKDDGRFSENAVLLDLIQRGYEPSFFQGKKEVDFVVWDAEKMYLFNVCNADEIPDREYEGFEEFKKTYPKVKVERVIISKRKKGIDHEVDHYPLSEWLYRENDPSGIPSLYFKRIVQKTLNGIER